MQCEIVVREATAQDFEARAELVRRSITEYDFEAFILFFFQELTLQVCVLCGAVLFIFGGAGLGACACVVPAAAVVLACGVLVTHRALADTHVQRIRKEVCGFVAEYRGPLVAEPHTLRPRVRLAAGDTPGGPGRVVGTASVSECWGPRRAGWLHALGVAAARRGRGAAGGVSRARAGGAAGRARQRAAGLRAESAAHRRVGDARLVRAAGAGRGAHAAHDAAQCGAGRAARLGKPRLSARALT